MALCHRVHGPFDLKTLPEVDDPRRLPGNAPQQFMALDDLEVVEPSP
jgi:hypothetical protein